MTFQDAVNAYQKNPTKETLLRETSGLTGEMSLREKIYMLSGHTIGQTQVDMIKTHRNYNVRALRAGGCKRLGVPPVLFFRRPARCRHGELDLLPGQHASCIRILP